MKSKKLTFLFIHFVFCLISLQLYAQKYYFQHYDIENGLLQSQVLDITQDNRHQLWLSTLGGVNCFDSKQFTAFTTEDGLQHNASYCIAADKNGRVLCGNAGKIGCFERGGLTMFPFETKETSSGVWRIICDRANIIWAARGRRLYRLYGNRMKIEQVAAENEIVTAARTDKTGNLYVSILSKGIYKFENNRWKLIWKADMLPRMVVMDFAVDPNKAGQIYIITGNSFYVFNGDSLINRGPKIIPGQSARFTCILLDKKNDIWIGADNGAYLITNDHVVFFNEKNGFTNLRVFCIYEDSDDHIWLGTDGAGMFKYSHDNFQIYDKTQGLTNDVVMNMAKTPKGEIYMCTNGGGVISYKDHEIKNVPLPIEKLMSLRVNCLFNDVSGTLWIGTDNSGLWTKQGAVYSKIYPGKGDDPYVVFTSITQDNAKTLWFTTNMGCYYLDGRHLVKVNGMNDYCNTAVEIGKDSMLVGKRTGVALIHNKKVDPGFLPAFPKAEVTSLQYARPFVLAGTTSGGVVICNDVSGAMQNITTKDHLPSSMVYSLQVINNILWVGTGRGINKYLLKQEGDHLKTRMMAFSSLPCECNQNAMLRVQDNLWIGTTHGVYIYPLYTTDARPAPPAAVIENIQMDQTGIKPVAFSYYNGYKLPSALSLPSAQSRLSIKFQAIAFNDQKVLFQYKLDGLDNDYSKPMSNNVVDYPGLPPGNYIFKVRALTDDGVAGNAADFNFTVTPAFYQTVPFKILMSLLLLSLMAGIFGYKAYTDKKELYLINQVKLQEQENVRRQTAEDFHDDLGNKLTRINMLSELLDKKISPDLTDEKSLITQIRLSATEMYAGTKKILWALNPNNDNLKEIIKELVVFTTGIFENTAIILTVYPYKPEIDLIKLPLGYSHNLTLIFKELMNNILKHSEAELVTISIDSNPDNTIEFTVKDNGKGFLVNDFSTGNGMRNIKKRAAKLNGEINISSAPGAGTAVWLKISIPRPLGLNTK